MMRKTPNASDDLDFKSLGFPGHEPPPRPRLTFLVTAAVSAGFFRGQLAFLVANGCDVDFASSPGPQLDATRDQGARPWAVPMEREIAPLRDLVSLWRLWRLFRRTHPDLVVAGTPKAGLLGTIAARLAGVPRVVYTLHGLRLETTSGWKRCLLWSTEWLACHAAHGIRSVSLSLRARMIDLGLTAPEHCVVIGSGTSNGVDVEHWRRTSFAELAGQETRHRLGIAQSAPLVGFVGRLTRDKGIAELYAAFTRLRRTYPDLRLLLVGGFEAGDPVPAALRSLIETDSAVSITHFVADVAPYYWAMDILTLPTYREGFPGVPLEAQAASVPVVTTDATGAADAILDGITGLRIPVGDADALTVALDRLLGDSQLRSRMGRAGCKWVQERFARETVWQELLVSYRSILQAAHTPRNSLARSLEVGLLRVAALFALILSAPFWLAVAVAIRCSLGSPVLFRQLRPGLGGRPFTLMKFRTMRDARDENGVLLQDSQRLTRLGKLLRMLSIDELPQLWNVLRGEMSLVGPRPLLMQYLDRYTPEQARRHEVLPGITGWAQVNGRNAIGWEEKFALDVWYVDHWSIGLDLRILARTARNVVLRRGISSSNHATMPEFFAGNASENLDR
jgi:lipopolysaccharide/colanic/teichoic acid biosynthesis glycosyltransferase